MNDTVLIILNSILNFVEMIAFLLFCSCFFYSRLKGVKRFVIFIVFISIILVIHVMLNGYTIVKALILILVYSFCAFSLFQRNFLLCAVTAVFFVAIFTVCDAVFIAGLQAVSGRSTQALLDNQYGYYALCYCTKIMELLLIVILKQAIQNKDLFQASSWQNWVRTLMFPALTALITLFLMQIYDENDQIALPLLLSSIALMIIDIIAIFLLGYLEEQRQKLHDYTMLQYALKQERENLDAWMSAYESQRKLTHEFNNQLIVIRGLAQSENTDHSLVSDYIDQLLRKDMSDSLFIKTGRTVVDIILNQKHANMDKKGIQLMASLDDLAEFPLEDNELVVVLSNLIDNAVEACEKISDPERRIIRLNMKFSPEVCFLYMENPCNEPLTIRNNQIVSSKRGPQEHGYGLKNVTAILQAHQAIYAIEYLEDQQMFRFSTQILPSVKE